jgi:hypothetical protein
LSPFGPADTVYRSLITQSDTLQPDDRRRLLALLTLDRSHFAAALRAYYGDLDRADRTPRQLLYFHLGWLAGLCVAPEDTPDA